MRAKLLIPILLAAAVAISATVYLQMRATAPAGGADAGTMSQETAGTRETDASTNTGATTQTDSSVASPETGSETVSGADPMPAFTPDGAPDLATASADALDAFARETGYWFNERTGAWELSHVKGKRLPQDPVTVAVGQRRLTRILANGDWVSPGLGEPTLYKLGFRTCPDCVRYERREFDRLHEAGIDTRVYLYARRDDGLTPKSTPEERAALALIYSGGGWPVYEAWTADIPEAFYETTELPVVESDEAAEAVVEKGRQTREQLEALMAENGYDMEVPSLFWRNAAGDWRVFLGDNEAASEAIYQELRAIKATQASE